MRKFNQYNREILQLVYLIIMLFCSTSSYPQSTRMKFNEQEYIAHLKFLAADLLTRESYTKFLSNLEVMIAEGKMNRLRSYDPERGCLITNLSKITSE